MSFNWANDFKVECHVFMQHILSKIDTSVACDWVRSAYDLLEDPRHPGAEPDERVWGPGVIFTGGPYDVIHDVIVCKRYDFSD